MCERTEDAILASIILSTGIAHATSTGEQEVGVL